jgi:DNA-directed RNA polymerase specialized sigma24 family protein
MSVITNSGRSAIGEREKRGGDVEDLRARGRARTRISPALAQRLAILPSRDRAIVELTMSAKLTRAGIARALGMAPGQVSRRLRVLYQRLHDPLVVALFDPACPLPPEHRQLGIEHFLLGLAVNQLADKHGMRWSAVQSMLTFVRGWHNGMTGGK